MSSSVQENKKSQRRSKWTKIVLNVPKNPLENPTRKPSQNPCDHKRSESQVSLLVKHRWLNPFDESHACEKEDQRCFRTCPILSELAPNCSNMSQSAPMCSNMTKYDQSSQAARKRPNMLQTLHVQKRPRLTGNFLKSELALINPNSPISIRLLARVGIWKTRSQIRRTNPKS